MTKTDSCLCAQPYYGDRCEKIMRGMLDGIFFVNINFVLILSQPACFLSLLKKKKKKKKRTFVLFCVVVFAKKKCSSLVKLMFILFSFCFGVASDVFVYPALLV